MPETAGNGPTRAEEIQALARDYLSDPERASYNTHTIKVMMLAGRLGSEDAWNTFATMVKIVWDNNPDDLNLPPWATMKAHLSDLKKAVLRALRRASREPGGMAQVENIDQMLQSESPLFVCIGLLLRQRRGRIWFDDFLVEIRSDWRGDGTDDVVEAYDVGDETMLKIMVWLMARNIDVLGHVNKRTVEDAVAYVANLDHRDVLMDHVKGMPQWDGVPRIGELMTRGFGAAVDDSIGQTQEYLNAIGSNWMISQSARALRPGCKVDTMPIFMGAQGTKKSTAMGILGGPFFAEISEPPTSKDFYMQIQGVWVGEVAELASIAITRNEIAKVKAALSRCNDKFRAPYARKSQYHPRRTVFGGTANPSGSGVLRDETGNRRYDPVVCGFIDTAWLEANRAQMIAEAVKRLEDGATWWEVPEEAHRIAVGRQQAVSIYDDEIRERLLVDDLWDHTATTPEPILPSPNAGVDTPERWGNLVTPLRVAVQWLRIPYDQAERQAHVVRAALTRLGWRSGAVAAQWVGGRTQSSKCWEPVDKSARERARVNGELLLDRTNQMDIPF